MRAAVACACLLAAAPGVLRAQSEVGAIVDRAAAYVEEFQRRFGSMVTEERYEQSVNDAVAIGARTRPQFERVTLVSDFLLVQVPGEGWMPFRDVFERNGQKVRDREERLARLFLNGASRSSVDQARQIMLEGARYNIGTIERTINLPTLPLVFLTPAIRERFRSSWEARPEDGTIVEFHEVRTPTYISDREGRDMPSTGGSGSTRRPARSAAPSWTSWTRRRSAHQGGLPVSTTGWRCGCRRMEERYRDRRTTSEVRGVATYSRFRKFQVSTSEEVAQ
jgi:hypothetical protein